MKRKRLEAEEIIIKRGEAIGRVLTVLGRHILASRERGRFVIL